MIDNIHVGNIYQINQPVIFTNQIQPICFKVIRIHNHRDGRFLLEVQNALADNNDAILSSDMLIEAYSVPLTRLLLLYLGFQYIEEQLPGIQGVDQFVCHNSVNGQEIVIRLLDEGNGSFDILRYVEGRYQYVIGDRLRTLDALQNYMRDHYYINFDVSLETVNHACLYADIITTCSNAIADQIHNNGPMVESAIMGIVVQLYPNYTFFDNDRNVIIELGISGKLFKREIDPVEGVLLTSV